ncbi:hypothetical protein LZ31DRAFT_300272 [Colletotrichum somersetense]|nr:hypothetical protein LZ31DRAFT_300272 [Colletotrichum somersetense]
MPRIPVSDGPIRLHFEFAVYLPSSTLHVMLPWSVDEKLDSCLMSLAYSPYNCLEFNHLGLSRRRQRYQCVPIRARHNGIFRLLPRGFMERYPSTVFRDCKKGRCLELLLTDPWNYHLHHLAFESRELNRLEELLPSHNGKALPVRQRRAIAVALASRVLQLCDTPWLRES